MNTEEKQTKNENLEFILSILTTMLLTLISKDIASPFWKIIFILCYVAGVTAYLTLPDPKKRKWTACLCGLAAALILILSSYEANITFPDMIAHIGDFFSNGKKDLEIHTIYQTELASMEQSLEKLSNEIDDYTQNEAMLEQISTRMEQLSQSMDINRFWDKQADDAEVENIIQTVKAKRQKWENDPFPDLASDKHQIELMYKMWLASEPYRYYNLVRAMGSMGIDCAAFEINEYTLMLWDTEFLFDVYNMRKSHENNLGENVFHEVLYENFNQYRASTQEHSDTFDYGNWGWDFNNNRTDQIMDFLDIVIMAHCEKMYINFGP